MGAVVYSGLQAEHNATAAPGVKPVGIMIVTRLKAQADEVVSDINAYVGRHVAVADHTDSRATPEQLHESDIVVITHAAYTRAKETLSGVNADRWHRLTRWRGAKSFLVKLPGHEYPQGLWCPVCFVRELFRADRAVQRLRASGQ